MKYKIGDTVRYKKFDGSIRTGKIIRIIEDENSPIYDIDYGQAGFVEVVEEDRIINREEKLNLL